MNDPKTVPLFGEEILQPVDPAAISLGGGPPLRAVYFYTDEKRGPNTVRVEHGRPCLVRCDGGERNLRTVAKLKTLCGQSCLDDDGELLITRTSAIPPTDVLYCQTCHSLAGNGVLR